MESTYVNKKIEDESQKAFMAGQEAWRHGKALIQNPYHKRYQEGSWADGWQSEEEANSK